MAEKPVYSNWLMPVAGDDSTAHCKFCNKIFAARLASLKIHQESDQHKKHERDRGLSARSAQFMENYASSSSTTAEKLRQKKEAELRMCAFIAEHTSFRTAPHLATLVSKTGDQTPRLGKTKASALIKNVMAPSYKSDLINAVRGKPFSLIIDEVTDVSVSKAVGIVIRYCDLENGKIVDTFYRLIQVTRGDAKTLWDAIYAALVEDNLDIRWFVGLGVDGATCMVGRHLSVSTLARQSAPHLTTVRCVSHSLAKVAQYAVGVFGQPHAQTLFPFNPETTGIQKLIR